MSLLRESLAMPAIGEARRVQRGRWQLVFERDRGGLSLVAHDGRAEQRFFFGVPDAGQLEVRVGAPRQAVRVQLAERIAVAPGGRLRGYLTVPLPLTVAWRAGDNGAGPGVLAELTPPGLRLGWFDGSDADRGLARYLHLVESSFSLDGGGTPGAVAAAVPVILRNARDRVVAPVALDVRLRDEDLRDLRGRIVAVPRRLDFMVDGTVRELARRFPAGRR